jgi:hypothetical protein
MGGGKVFFFGSIRNPVSFGVPRCPPTRCLYTLPPTFSNHPHPYFYPTKKYPTSFFSKGNLIFDIYRENFPYDRFFKGRREGF